MFVCPVCKNIALKSCCETVETFDQQIITLNNVAPSEIVKAKSLQSNTTQVNCSKCGSNNVQVLIVQNRSADESATMRIQCLDCGAKESA